MSDQEPEEQAHRWWIVDPIAHRRWENAQPKPETTEWMGHQVPVVYQRIDEDVWICDWCNSSIPIEVEAGNGTVLPRMVPMEDNKALCPACMRKSLQRDGLPSTGAEAAEAWGWLVCSCGGCQRALDQILNPEAENGVDDGDDGKERGT